MHDRTASACAGGPPPPAARKEKKEAKKAAKEAEAAAAAAAAAAVAAAEPVDEEAAAVEAEMMKLMGFSGFNSTQGQHVEDPNANVSGFKKKTTRRARQYMNRPGGFNRPLPDELTGVKSNKI